MSFFWISVSGLGGLLYLLLKGINTLKRKKSRPAGDVNSIVRIRENVENALASGDITMMTALLEATNDPLLQDALLTRIVAIYYRMRSEPAAREAFYRYSGRHIDMIPTVLTAIGQSGNDRPGRIETFKLAAIAMEEDKRYDEAIILCNKALSYGLKNGTKTGFEGRIGRLEKKRNTARTSDSG